MCRFHTFQNISFEISGSSNQHASADNNLLKNTVLSNGVIQDPTKEDLAG